MAVGDVLQAAKTERCETPPPELDTSHAFTGIELITLSGLPQRSFSSATKHLQDRINRLKSEGHENLPDLQIVSPSRSTELDTDPLDYVYVSLAGSLRATPWPDILENVRQILDHEPGIHARWRVTTGPTDKTR